MFYEIGYHAGNGVFSVNMVKGDTLSTEKYAREYARRHGYELAYILPITEKAAENRMAKGMPYKNLQND